MDKLIDETSNKYGTYTVLEHIIGTKPTLWMCKCDCGNIIKCSGYDGCYPRGDNKWVGCYRDFSGKRRTVSGNDRTSVIAECVAKRFSSIQELIIRNDFKIEDVAISRISNMSCYDFVLSEIINYENVHDPK